MGIRQSFGLIMPPLTRDIAVSVADFALAMSVQNLAWGFLQPVAGALAVRVGFRPVMLGGSVPSSPACCCLPSRKGCWA